MPVITFEMTPMSKEQKQEIVKGFTETAVRVTGIPAEAFYVLIHENQEENVRVGGTLLADMED